MSDLKRVIPLLHPVPIVLVGTTVKERVNYTTIGDVSIAGLNPPLLMLSLHRDHFSTQGLKEHGLFSVNVPSREMLDVVDYCGMKSGKDVDKSLLISTQLSREGIPYAEETPISLCCRVVESVTVETRVIFVARVLETIVRDDLIEGEKINFEGINTILYGLNNQYYGPGEVIGTGYHEGKKIIQERKKDGLL
ncbi:MAG TPA: flavin reductase family protein [Thermotogota bacterium]|nr:flavin reductase family protein [Thermotogota bacterium]HPJ88434.1 flavin reductase family protein [Thermotogota bacterium]HPR95399.1 flavin reductase family protein [Thermotogota bacterium]